MSSETPSLEDMTTREILDLADITGDKHDPEVSLLHEIIEELAFRAGDA